MRFFNKKKILNEQDIRYLDFIKNCFLPLMILGRNKPYRSETINKILKEKGNFFIKLYNYYMYEHVYSNEFFSIEVNFFANFYEEFNNIKLNYKCPFLSKEFIIKSSKIKDIYLNELHVIQIKMPTTPEDTFNHRSMAIIAYNNDMTKRKYVTVEKVYKNYDMFCCDDNFSYRCDTTYSKSNLLKLLQGDYDYSSAPKAEFKKNVLDFFMDTEADSMGAMILHLPFIICFLYFCINAISPFLKCDFIILAILLSPVYYFIFKKIKSLLEKYIGEQAIIETHNSKQIKADLIKTAFKLGSILIAISIAIIALSTISAYYSITDIETVIEDEFDENKIYRIEEFFILDDYAQEQDESRIYYYASFTNKNRNIYFISFSTDRDRNIANITDKSSISISGYFQMSKVSKNLWDFFEESCRYIAHNANRTFYVKMNTKYICSLEENVLLHLVIKKYYSSILALLMSLAGIWIFLKAVYFWKSGVETCQN